MYNSQKMEVFSQRVQAWNHALQNVREEALRLDAIYTQEAESGSHADWDDTEIATAAEHVEAIVLMRAFETFIDPHEARMTPFLQ